MKYEDWLKNITVQQVRAFASQVGVGKWRNDSIKNLTTALSRSKEGRRIYKEVYGT